MIYQNHAKHPICRKDNNRQKKPGAEQRLKNRHKKWSLEHKIPNILAKNRICFAKPLGVWKCQKFLTETPAHKTAKNKCYKEAYKQRQFQRIKKAPFHICHQKISSQE